MRKYIFLTILILVMSLSFTPSLRGEIHLIGQGSIPGDAADDSELTGTLEDGTPKNRLGAFGSAIAYTGRSNRYIGLSDRGPADGKTSYINRFHEFDISISEDTIHPSLLRTVLLKNESGDFYTGSISAFDANNSPHSLRLDSEGVRVGYKGTIFVSDEYGPSLYEFDRKTGQRIRTLNIPKKFLISRPDASEDNELLPHNSSGRQHNRGIEGLAISPDGQKLFGIMQSPLIQDRGLDDENKRHGLNVRLLELSLGTENTKEYLYPLDHEKNGLNEILAVNGHEFLVIERDGKAGMDAKTKKIYKINISKANDISSIDSLPQDVVPEGIVPVDKQLFIDLLAPDYGLGGNDFPEKIEGLAFGPDLKGGRHLLLVTTDNDFDKSEPSRILAFAIDQTDLPGFQPQKFSHAKRYLLMGGLLVVLVLVSLIARRKFKR